MKVALVHGRSSWTGGTERYLSQLARELVRRSHAVEVVCKTHRGPPVEGASYRMLSAPGLGGAAKLQAFARAVERHVARTAYDVVVGLGKTWTHDVIRLGGGTHQSYLELAHGETLAPWERWLGVGRGKHRAALAIERRALAPGAFRRVIANSRMVQRDVCARYPVAPEQVVVIENGVDLERFDRERQAARAAALRAELGLEQAFPLVLFLGTGYGRKGLALVLEALPALHARHPRAALLIAGFDSGEARYRARARELGIAERCRFLGGRSDAEAIYAAADLYVLPTLYDPFANTTLEALASGLPVLTTVTNGGSEVLDEGVQGSILPAGVASDLLAERLLEWADPERIAQARGATRQRALRHPADRTAARSADLLEAVAEEKARAAR